MTYKRDLKKLVRERQERTGEHYTTALRHVIAQRRAPVPVVAMVDLSEAAARLGLTCHAAMVPALALLVDGAFALERVRAALLATEGDPATALLRGAVLRGEQPDVAGWSLHNLEKGRHFMARVRAGIAGASDGGHMLALNVPSRAGASQLVVCMLWPTAPIAACARRASLILSGGEGLYDDQGWSVWGLR